MARLQSRSVLGEAGTVFVTSGTSTGSYDAVTALSAGTADITVSGTAGTGLAIAAGVTVFGDISQIVVTSGGPFAAYKRTS
jgi:hypothetical protein